MWHKRLNLSIFLWLSLGVSGLQAQRIYVEGQEGAQRAYFLSDIIKMSFSSDMITVFKLDGGSDNYSIMDVRNLHFKLVTLSEGVTMPAHASGTFQVFPNPVMETLNIRLSSPPGSAGKIEILSLEGKLLRILAFDGNTMLYQINVSNLPSGLYICRINSGPVIQTRKIIKQ
jgi:hypothetical protein